MRRLVVGICALALIVGVHADARADVVWVHDQSGSVNGRGFVTYEFADNAVKATSYAVSPELKVLEGYAMAQQSVFLGRSLLLEPGNYNLVIRWSKVTAKVTGQRLASARVDAGLSVSGCNCSFGTADDGGFLVSSDPLENAATSFNRALTMTIPVQVQADSSAEVLPYFWLTAVSGQELPPNSPVPSPVTAATGAAKATLTATLESITAVPA